MTSPSLRGRQEAKIGVGLCDCICTPSVKVSFWLARAESAWNPQSGRAAPRYCLMFQAGIFHIELIHPNSQHVLRWISLPCVWHVASGGQIRRQAYNDAQSTASKGAESTTGASLNCESLDHALTAEEGFQKAWD